MSGYSIRAVTWSAAPPTSFLSPAQSPPFSPWGRRLVSKQDDSPDGSTQSLSNWRVNMSPQASQHLELFVNHRLKLLPICMVFRTDALCSVMCHVPYFFCNAKFVCYS